MNKTRIEFSSHSVNESFARMTAAAFVSYLDPAVSDIADIKTAVSEAVTNAIIPAMKARTALSRWRFP